MKVRAGYGAPELHLRMEKDELRRAFGSPERKRKGDAFRLYYLYPKLGFECIVSERTGKVLSIFFHRPADPGSSLKVRTADGLAIGDGKAKLADAYPKPDKRSDGFRLSNGVFVGPWMSYDNGIGFHLDSENRIQTISIFAPVRRHAIRAAKNTEKSLVRDTRFQLMRAG